MAVSNSTDRFNGVLASKALKVACRRATAVNQALTGNPGVIDGYSWSDGDRILLIGQTNGVENGIWEVNLSAAWSRAADFDGIRDAGTSTLVTAERSVGNPVMYVLLNAEPVRIGTDVLTFQQYFDPDDPPVSGLQEVTDVGNTTTNAIIINGVTAYQPYLSLTNAGRILLENTTADGDITFGAAATDTFQLDANGVTTRFQFTGFNEFRILGTGAPAGAVLTMGERNDISNPLPGPLAAFATIWVRDDTPNVLVFTDDAGTDWVLNKASTLQAVTDEGNTTTNDIDLTGSNLILDDTGEVQFGTVAGGEIGIRYSAANNALEVYDISATNTDFRIGPGLNNLIVNPEANSNATLRIGETTTLRGDGQNAIINLYGEDTGVIDLVQLQNTGAFFWINAASVPVIITGQTGQPMELNVDSLKLSEVAAAPADELGYGQIWVNSADAGLLYFTDELGNDYNLTAGGSGILSAKLAYDSTITSGDPGAGNFRLSSPTPSAATAMYVNDVDLNGVDMQAVMQQTAVGKLFRFANPDDPEIFNEYRVTSYTDNTGWWTVGINYVQGTNTLPAATTECRFEWLTRPAIDAGAFSGNSSDLAIWDKAGQDKWVGTGTALRVNTSSPSTDGRLVMGSMTTTTTVNPYIKLELGNSDNTVLFAQRLNNTQGYYQRANLNSSIDYRFGYRTSSVDTDIVRLTADDEFNIMAGGTLVFTERAAARAATAAEGELWVRNDAPNVLVFTDDDGTDWQLNNVGAQATTISAGWSTGSGGSLTVAANAPIFYNEQAADDTPGAGQGQVWVRNDTPNTLMFTDDAGTDWVVGGSAAPAPASAVLTGKWTYDGINTGMSNPGSGFIRFSNLTLTSSNRMSIHYIDVDGTDWEQHMLDAWGSEFGILVRMVKVGDPLTYVVWSINSDSDQLTYNVPYINLVEFEGTWTDGDEIYIEIQTQPYIDRPTTNYGLYVGYATLSGQPLCGLRQTALLTHNPTSGAAELSFNDGGPFIISVNNGAVTMSGGSIWRNNASNRHEWYGASNILPRLTVSETAVTLGHANDAGNGAPQFYMRERTSLAAPGIGWGGLAVLNSTPNQLWFIDDANNTYNLTDPGAGATTITAGWSTGSGGSLTIAANAPLFYTEQAADDNPAAGQGQVWVRNDTPNTLMFTDDAGTDWEIGGSGIGLPTGATAGSVLEWSGSAWVESTDLLLTANNPTFQSIANGDPTVPNNLDLELLFNSANNNYGQIGFNAGINFEWISRAHGGNMLIRGENASGTLITALDFDPDGPDVALGVDLDVNDNVIVSNVTNGNISFLPNGTGWVEVQTGKTFRVYDSADTDYIQIWHDGTDGRITANGGVLNFVGETLLDPVLQDYAVEAVSYTPTGTTQTLTYSDGPAFEVDLESVTGNITITLAGAPSSGLYGQMVVKVTQDSVTARTITWAGGTFRWPGGTAHPMNTTLDGFTIYTFETWDGGTTWWATGADYS